MKIYLIRHAESASRDGMIYDKACLVSLSEKGKVQARALGRIIPKLGIETFFVSPLARTKETFEIINKVRKPVVYDERLREHMPSRTKTAKEFKDIRIRTRLEYDFAYEDGESFNQVAERFIEALHEIIKSPYQTVGIVSHALIMEAALTKLFNLSKIPTLEEASYSRIDWDGENFKIVYINRTASFFHNLKNIIKKIIGKK
jgi:broad specificity phosphatase PhoE